jgi:hypothetical protein
LPDGRSRRQQETQGHGTIQLDVQKGE